MTFYYFIRFLCNELIAIIFLMNFIPLHQFFFMMNILLLTFTWFPRFELFTINLI